MLLCLPRPSLAPVSNRSFGLLHAPVINCSCLPPFAPKCLASYSSNASSLAPEVSSSRHLLSAASLARCWRHLLSAVTCSSLASLARRSRHLLSAASLARCWRHLLVVCVTSLSLASVACPWPCLSLGSLACPSRNQSVRSSPFVRPSVRLSVRQSVSQSVSQSISQSVSQSVNQ